MRLLRFAFYTCLSQTACCLIGRLPICMMESALAELHCNIHRERQISSNSISGFQQGSSSKLYSAVLYCPKGAPRGKKKKEKKDDQKPLQNGTAVLLQSAQNRKKHDRNDHSFLSSFFQATKSRPGEGGLKKDEEELTRTPG